jgi:hypothetical protein
MLKENNDTFVLKDKNQKIQLYCKVSQLQMVSSYNKPFSNEPYVHEYKSLEEFWAHVEFLQNRFGYILSPH